ncbi:TIGR03084 family protein [Geodermatophilus saharensis]|uniref:TIGR03084 family protein n=1 Tax=Geodermatophilus saharensis TaxID=1137994 RepID=A0A239D4I1_9ACTN|nr:TIGR03084 family metal-binding protein [Geodermatophilus saharensis]SNS27416.1 TIGR03084 family protein [Geodermatophilus saharensis]
MTDPDRPDARAAARLRLVTADLAAETRSLQEVLDGAGPGRWATPTPAAGWTVQDQVHHLAYFDEATVLAATDPARFRREAAGLTAPGDDFPDRLVRDQRSLTPVQSAAWSTRARAALLDLAASASPGLRLPWYGPDMGITSALTARLMETWAHGQDVADALGVAREPTDRLRHVAHLGVATRAFAFRLRGLDPPGDDVAVELTAPSGAVWRWGNPVAAQRVTGPALDFCLVVTQRRHPADTALTVTGDVAARWMAVAQAFAGVPGPGRQPLGGDPGRRS